MTEVPTNDIPTFADEIERNRNSHEVSTDASELDSDESSVRVRRRGAFVTDCSLTSPSSGEIVSVLYSEEDLTKPKISASHAMVPAGPYDGIGGQHGFPRWADYRELAHTGPSDERAFVSLRAMRSDDGLSLTRSFELKPTSLSIETTIRNSTNLPEHTSMGEHLYFNLENENFEGLKINGHSLDELLGEGSRDTVQDSGTLFWGDFDGTATIEFPSGHNIKLSAIFDGTTLYPVAMWIWKRADSPSICFEPVVGVKHLDEDDTSGLSIIPFSDATLTTRIELL